MLVWLRFGDVSQLCSTSVIQATLFPKPNECLGNMGTRVVYSKAEDAARRRSVAIRPIEVQLEQLLT
jgi:hypothetical protein